MTTAGLAQTTGFALTSSERRVWADIQWAEQNEEVQSSYAGQWVALYERQVVAHGLHRDQVVRAAVTATQRSAEELAIWPIAGTAALLEDPPPDAPEF
jgi:hypothetical protein